MISTGTRLELARMVVDVLCSAHLGARYMICRKARAVQTAPFMLPDLPDNVVRF
ncbi:hypothetical protein [Roseibium sp. RKSG952]|uniref:hypothetical protein n=1 Tax=Roseibium sp. RKSG952 TaxID=2529384 RepID=UPI0012BBD135|nr:hypothetical protein [Roseibium sp. RKSG952]